VAPIAIRWVLRVFAHTEVGLLILLDRERKWREGSPAVRAIAERLSL